MPERGGAGCRDKQGSGRHPTPSGRRLLQTAATAAARTRIRAFRSNDGSTPAVSEQRAWYREQHPASASGHRAA